MQKLLPVVLASASPRRQEMMVQMGVPFEVAPSLAPEDDVLGTGPERVKVLARRKAEEVAARMPGRLVLAADTLVCVDGQVLGKPVDEEDAVQMLKTLSGRVNQVATGVCMIAPDGSVQEEVCLTDVRFATLDEETIRRYVLTGEPMDKAGAYAVQGRAGAFVTEISGSPSNVIGMPMETVARFLKSCNVQLFSET